MRARLRFLGQLTLITAAGLSGLAWGARRAGPPAQVPLADTADALHALERALEIAPAPSAPPLALTPIPERVLVAQGQHEAATLVQSWAAARGLTLSVDPQVRPLRLGFDSPCELDAEALRAVLDDQDLVLVRGPGATLHLVHRRNLATRFGPPWARVEDGVAVDPDRIVTREVTIRHGGGNQIFALLRGLLSRDMNRVGNVLYVAGAEQLVIVDFARNVRYFEELARALDVPSSGASRPLRLLAWSLPAAEAERLRSGAASTQLALLRELTVEGEASPLMDVACLAGAGASTSLRAGERSIEVQAQARQVRVELTGPAAAREEKAPRLTLSFPLQEDRRPLVQLAADPSDPETYLAVALLP